MRELESRFDVLVGSAVETFRWEDLKLNSECEPLVVIDRTLLVLPLSVEVLENLFFDS